MMDANNNQLDDIRRQWQEMQIDARRLEDTNRRLSVRLSAERASTQQQQLSRYFLRIGAIGVVLMPSLAYLLYHSISAPLWLAILYAIIGLALAAINFGFGVFVGKSNYISLPTCEAVAHARRVLLWQSRLRNIGIALAAIVLLPLLWYLYESSVEGVFIGGVIGGVVGGILGILQYRKKRKAMRRMLSELETDDTEDA